MTATLNVDLRTIDLDKLGKLNRGEVTEYVPAQEVRVYNDAYGYEQFLQVTRIVRDGAVNSRRYTIHLDDGAALPLDVYTNPLAVSVTFAHSPF